MAYMLELSLDQLSKLPVWVVSNDDVSVLENRHSSCPLQEGEWSDQGEWQTSGDDRACNSPVQGECLCVRDWHNG